MTAKKPLPSIARCVCGKRAEAYHSVDKSRWTVTCLCGWTGANMGSERAAILAWNRVMGNRPKELNLAKLKRGFDKIRRGE